MQSGSNTRLSTGRKFGLLFMLGIVGCTSTDNLVHESLDPLTSVTVTSSKTPFVFYRDVPSRAAYARNYLHLGPIGVNRGGSHRYYLWVSAWSTMQDSDLADQRSRLESIVVFADGEPLILDLSGHTPAAIGTSETTYLKPVASAAEAYYEVSIDQIRLIAGARDVRINSGPSLTDNYEPWENQARALESWRAFLERLAY